MTSTISLGGAALRVGVLAVQGDVREHIRVIKSLGGEASAVRRPSELEQVEGVIIPGGESTTMDKLTRAFGLAEPLRELIREGFPVYGSCAGMIMLADTIADPSVDLAGNPQQTIGGLDIVVRRNAFGRQRESFETDLPFEELPGNGSDVHAVFIRAPWVEKVGESVKVLAQVEAPDTPPAEHGAHTGRDSARAQPVARIVAVRSGNLLATSFHPEVTGEHRIHELFLSLIAQRRAEHVGAL
ncbi:pyridoxal 5'-phosphate synthase glutaminase subunit PdxT [Arthrobacter parietis]|uniref:Pyridoxal 5'-phosphate synthase subunit PdxT n=2 Tax=Arthrobacter TaxID=1663 RepID=A0ABT6CUW8_9MICC|nr:pyridoxal 5'-phosphate synthase glutaminase subunit PdxT [Arthrobacter vasquezii]MDF9277866.1 pyridoxal 5'-phosphate synthase glutaminase subunit PdxT [Arthrobacter vasquezii]